MTGATVSYILDPRFPGGTSSAVAAELEVMAQMAQLRVYAIETKMFKSREIAPQLQAAFNALDIEPIWNPKTISGDLVVFHNPSCLRFEEVFPAQIVARHLVVIEHENFVHPTGQDAFDAEHCHTLLARHAFVLDRTIAPISNWNRDTITRWQQNGPDRLTGWSMLSFDWFNICDFDMTPPTKAPQDRRGRHSRPGFDKFPALEVLEQCFPPSATCNLILGGDSFIDQDTTPAHWDLIPFRGMEVRKYLEVIDFMVYFTAQSFRESFGRVLAEGVAAGKIVITDSETARAFGPAVVACEPAEVDEVIASYIADPERYANDVRAAQTALTQYGPEPFRKAVNPLLVAAAPPAVAA